jgi:hypothetical protein
MIQIDNNNNAVPPSPPSTSGTDDLRALRDQSRHLIVELEQVCGESDADREAISHIREALTDIGNRIAELKLKRVRV